MIIYLYHKRHRITGLNYFGKTKHDPTFYNGSGVYWNAHLRKHGKDIENVQIWKFDDEQERSKFAIQFSKDNNIVESDHWANLCIEDGMMGGDKFMYMSPERLAEIRQKRVDGATKTWETRDRTSQAKTTAAKWANISSEEKTDIYNKVSATLKNKSPEEKDRSESKRRATLSARPLLTCPHCGLQGKSNNMFRYHFDNCKLSLPNNLVG